MPSTESAIRFLTPFAPPICRWNAIANAATAPKPSSTTDAGSGTLVLKAMNVGLVRPDATSVSTGVPSGRKRSTSPEPVFKSTPETYRRPSGPKRISAGRNAPNGPLPVNETMVPSGAPLDV